MEEKYMKSKKIIMITMCCLICVMAIGYAAFATNLTINGTANITSTWKVLFTKIEEVSKTSGVTITKVPTAEGTNATFNVDLKSPGDKIIYKITVANQGTLDAIINDITASETGSDAIKFEISGIKKGDKLAKATTTTFNVTISYDESITSQPETTNNTLTVNINYVQDLGQTITSEDVVIDKKILLSTQILKDNSIQSDSNIDFSTTNGNGLYYTSTNTEDNKVTYYFRGWGINNYVSFADNIWRIIRINEDESIRLIKQENIGESAFNENNNDNAYVGYMYGTAGSTTYDITHTNVNSSTIKTVIDKWYEDNLKNYNGYLADAGFCGDRSVAPSANTWDSNDTALGYGTNYTVYGPPSRLSSSYGSAGVNPQFKCPQSNDLYTTMTSTKGNKTLTYPIGLITADEVAYAGGKASSINNSYYLANVGGNFWTMSPSSASSESGMYGRFEMGILGSDDGSKTLNVLPVINLKSTVEITGGDGASSNPYVIKTN